MPAPPEEVEPSVSAALSQVIMHLLEKDPDRRYQTADGLVVDLERLLGARRPGGGPGTGICRCVC